jgi:hypothetical protein
MGPHGSRCHAASFGIMRPCTPITVRSIGSCRPKIRLKRCLVQALLLPDLGASAVKPHSRLTDETRLLRATASATLPTLGIGLYILLRTLGNIFMNLQARESIGHKPRALTGPKGASSKGPELLGTRPTRDGPYRPHTRVLSHGDKTHALHYHSPSRAGHQHAYQSPGKMTPSHSSRKCSKAVKGEERNYCEASSTSPVHRSASERIVHDILHAIYVPTKPHANTGQGAKPLCEHYPIRQFCAGVIVALCGPERSEKSRMMDRIMSPEAGARGGTGSQGPSRAMPRGRIWNCPIAEAVKQCSEMGCEPSARQARSHPWADKGDLGVVPDRFYP